MDREEYEEYENDELEYENEDEEIKSISDLFKRGKEAIVDVYEELVEEEEEAKKIKDTQEYYEMSLKEKWEHFKSMNARIVTVAMVGLSIFGFADRQARFQREIEFDRKYIVDPLVEMIEDAKAKNNPQEEKITEVYAEQIIGTDRVQITNKGKVVTPLTEQEIAELQAQDAQQEESVLEKDIKELEEQEQQEKTVIADQVQEQDDMEIG